MTETNTNDGLLEGMACPRCHQSGKFYIDITASARVYDDGTDEVDDVDWDNDSSAHCGGYDCDWAGTVWHLLGGQPLAELAAAVTRADEAQASAAVAAGQGLPRLAGANQRALDFARVAAYIAHDAYHGEVARLAGLEALHADYLASNG